MDTLGDGIGAQTDRNIKLCDLLGLNADETTSVRVELDPGSHGPGVVSWTGRRTLTAEQFGRLLDVFEGAAPAGPTLPTTDPWVTACDTCDGEGTVLTMVPGSTGEPVEGRVRCPDCHIEPPC